MAKEEEKKGKVCTPLMLVCCIAVVDVYSSYVDALLTVRVVVLPPTRRLCTPPLLNGSAYVIICSCISDHTLDCLAASYRRRVD